MALIVCGRTPVRLEETTACVSWRHAVFLALLPLPWPPVAPAPVRCPACPSGRRHWAPSQAQAQARPLVLTPCSYRGGGWWAASPSGAIDPPWTPTVPSRPPHTRMPSPQPALAPTLSPCCMLRLHPDLSRQNPREHRPSFSSSSPRPPPFRLLVTPPRLSSPESFSSLLDEAQTL